MLVIRSGVASDAPALARVFHDAVRIGAREAYSEEECAAWCPDLPEGKPWVERLTGADLLVAEVAGEVAGFMSLVVETGMLDMAFVHPDHERKGVATALLGPRGPGAGRGARAARNRGKPSG